MNTWAEIAKITNANYFQSANPPGGVPAAFSACFEHNYSKSLRRVQLSNYPEVQLEENRSE